MKPKVYLETSVVSYLTSRLSRDLVVAGHQQVTQEWWERRRDEFELYVSQIVIREAGAGDPNAAERRLDLLGGLAVLGVSEGALGLARALLTQGVLSPKAPEDALHIAIAAVHGMDYLLTWNCTHLANVQMRFAVQEVCLSAGCQPPAICTPEELMGE